MEFPIELSEYKALKFDIDKSLSDDDKKQLKNNIEVARDAIVFFTAYAGARGLGGHTGGAYDIVPELLVVDGFMKGNDKIYPVYFDESGHRVAIQYLMAVLNNELPVERLLHYREFSEKNPLPGHPEIGLTDGVKFSSGRLGHLWPFINGVAKANPGKEIVMFGSDGSQQEGNDAEAARFAVAHDLNVKLLLDDNNITIAGHPSDYMKGYDLVKTLKGHGMETNAGDPEDVDELYERIRKAFATKGPVALVNRRKMAVGIEGDEDMPHAHDVIKTETAINYLEKKGRKEAVEMLKNVKKSKSDVEYLGSGEFKKNRSEFGKIIVNILDGMSAKERENVFVVDSDLEGSTGINHIRVKYPEIFVNGGVMERNNYSACAGFGFEKGKQGIFATFSAFSEMVNSEITMARLNEANVLAHFSHAGVDAIADNTCHFGINVFFTDNGLADEKNTKLYFPADALQMKAVLEKIFNEPGLRFIFSTRSGTPIILKEDGSEFYADYKFTGNDEVLREGDGYIVSYGDTLYRALDAVERLKKEGINVGLINKTVLNKIDEAMMKKLAKAPFVLLVENQNIKTGLGVRFGTWLLQRGFKGKYDHLGVTKPGLGGANEQIPYQGLDSAHIHEKVEQMQ
ncbi:transketolase C-terminal domain-containing protein [Nanoarchaeota archaeon]